MATRFIKSAAQLNAEELLSRSTPEAKLAAEAALSFSKPPPAIVQEAKKDCAWWEAHLERLAHSCINDAIAYRKAVKEFKQSDAWREKYNSWAIACKAVLKITPQRGNQLIRDLTENYYEESESPPSVCDKLPPADHINKSNEKEEEEEAPRVHSADESKPRKPVNENGKPKQLMLVWGEIEQSVGRAINRSDELNRVCPNALLHARFLAQSKACMNTLEEWKASVK